MAKGQRLDVWLFDNGLFPSREAARRAVMAGLVRADGAIADKPGHPVKPGTKIDVTAPLHPFVGRGGLKLRRAIERFSYDMRGRIVVDVGASTGGFTDCALQYGAQTVYAVDVGYGQLDWKLRNDPRVVVMERTNFRHVSPEAFDPAPECAVMDVSFISTRLLIPVIQSILREPGDILSLIKPQFEAGRNKVGKGGIVRDPAVHIEVIEGLLQFVRTLGYQCSGLDFSPISGGDGNIEYLAWWQPAASPAKAVDSLAEIEAVVSEAWNTLQGDKP